MNRMAFYLLLSGIFLCIAAWWIAALKSMAACRWRESLGFLCAWITNSNPEPKGEDASQRVFDMVFGLGVCLVLFSMLLGWLTLK